MIHIPFFAHDGTLTQSEKLKWERKLRECTRISSASIGEVIKLGNILASDRSQRQMQEKTIPFVGKHLEGVPFQVLKSYSLLLGAARQVPKLKLLTSRIGIGNFM